MSWCHSSRNYAATWQWWDGMPVDHWSRPFRWLCWWCQQTLHWWERPRLMPSSVFLHSRWNSWECASYPGEVWRWSSAEDRSIGQGMQSDTVGGRLWCGCTPKLLRAFSRFTSVVIIVWGWAGGESIICPNTTSVLDFWAEPATKRSCWALTGLSFPWTIKRFLKTKSLGQEYTTYCRMAHI